MVRTLHTRQPLAVNPLASNIAIARNRELGTTEAVLRIVRKDSCRNNRYAEALPGTPDIMVRMLSICHPTADNSTIERGLERFNVAGPLLFRIGMLLSAVN